ncbi:DNL zinc finger-domain-containing protein [Xylaria digitata]|nr:DNL zinc finger-domain-containing protein [Xylaria digitata]
MASRVASRYLSTIRWAPRTICPSLLRPYPRLPRTLQPVAHRFAHTIPKPTIPAKGHGSSSPDPATPRKQLEPHYQLTFTCVPCTNRSTHIVSKQGYHKGSVLITCPSCRNRHVISDNLNIFGDRKITVEELLREKGQLVKRGTLGEEGDIEFWEDDPTDPSEVGEVSATSVEGGGEKDETRRLREARNPSSQATEPTPSASILPGDTNTRPSVQHVAHRNPTPATRRQYHTKRFKPPAGLQNPNYRRSDPINPLSDPEVNTSRPPPAPQGTPNTSNARKPLAKQAIASLRAELQRLDDYTGKEPTPALVARDTGHRSQQVHQATRRTMSATEEASTSGTRLGNGRVLQPWQLKMIKRIRRKQEERIQDIEASIGFKSEPENLSRAIFYRPSPGLGLVQHVKERDREVMKEPTVRNVLGGTGYNRLRFVVGDHDRELSVQMKPGIVARRRPLHGEWVEKPPAPYRSLIRDLSDAPKGSTHRRGGL